MKYHSTGTKVDDFAFCGLFESEDDVEIVAGGRTFAHCV